MSWYHLQEPPPAPSATAATLAVQSSGAPATPRTAGKASRHAGYKDQRYASLAPHLRPTHKWGRSPAVASPEPFADVGESKILTPSNGTSAAAAKKDQTVRPAGIRYRQPRAKNAKYHTLPRHLQPTIFNSPTPQKLRHRLVGSAHIAAEPVATVRFLAGYEHNLVPRIPQRILRSHMRAAPGVEIQQSR